MEKARLQIDTIYGYYFMNQTSRLLSLFLSTEHSGVQFTHVLPELQCYDTGKHFALKTLNSQVTDDEVTPENSPINTGDFDHVLQVVLPFI